MSSAAFSGLTVGDPAPDFTLPSTAGSDVTLSSFEGSSNVLLAFFPLAFTGTCTAEMCEFTTDLTKFESANAKVLGISVDSTPTLNEFKAKHGITIYKSAHVTAQIQAGSVVIEEGATFKGQIQIGPPEESKTAAKTAPSQASPRKPLPPAPGADNAAS